MFSREQHWAQVASRLVRSRDAKTYRTEYGIQCLRLPAAIHECGLCQTLAFIEAKAQGISEREKSGKKHFAALLEDLSEALGVSDRVAANGVPATPRGQLLAQMVRDADLMEYRRLSRDALHCANYLKRYAEAILKVQLGADTEEEMAGETV
jgi:CRISPR type III-B/RAMP module-associated protein Cmr5